MTAFFLSRLRPLGALPLAPITVSQERKAGWHLFCSPLDVLNLSASPSQSREGGGCPFLGQER